MINVQVDKLETESNANVIRRFTKRVQGAGILPRVRSIRYAKRAPSEYTKKKFVLRSIIRRKEVERLVKLGKMPLEQERTGKRKRRAA
jgi:hypothetical protein